MRIFCIRGISKLLNTIKIIKSKLNPSLEIEGFLLTMFDSRLRLANQIYDEVKRHFQELVFKTIVQRNVKLSEAPSHAFLQYCMMPTLPEPRIIWHWHKKL